MGFRKAFATVSSSIGPAGVESDVYVTTGALLLVVLCISRCRAIRNVKNDPVRDTLGARAVFGGSFPDTSICRDPPHALFTSTTRNYVCIYCPARKLNLLTPSSTILPNFNWQTLLHALFSRATSSSRDESNPKASRFNEGNNFKRINPSMF